MYELLREEILQSNSLQQRIVLGLATFVGLVFSLVFSGVLSQLDEIPAASVEVLLGAVLPIIAAATGIWLVEQSRVMMAGNYLYMLEHKIHRAVGGAPMSWENWLRRRESDLPEDVGMPGDGTINDPQDIYNLAYSFGYLFFFLGLAILTALLYGAEVVVPDLTQQGVTIVEVLQVVWGVFAVLPTVGLVVFGRQIISHAGQGVTTAEDEREGEASPSRDREDSGTDEDEDERPVIWAWEREAFEFDPPEPPRSLAETFERHGDRIDELDLSGEDHEERFEQLLTLAERGD